MFILHIHYVFVSDLARCLGLPTISKQATRLRETGNYLRYACCYLKWNTIQLETPSGSDGPMINYDRKSAGWAVELYDQAES